MIQLRKNRVTPLLGTIRGKAVPGHKSSPPTSQSLPVEDEDIERSPVSSDDDEMAAVADKVDRDAQEGARKSTATTSDVKGMGSATSRKVSEINANMRKRRKFQDEGPYTTQTARNTRAKISADEEAAEKIDMWTSQSQQDRKRASQRSQKSYGGSNKVAWTGFQRLQTSPSPEPASPPSTNSGFKMPNDSTKSSPKGQPRFPFLTPPSSSPPKATPTRSTFRKPQTALSEPAGQQKSNKRTFQDPALPTSFKRTSPRSLRSTKAETIDIVSSPPLSPYSSGSDLSTPPPETELQDMDLVFASTQTQSQRDLARCPVCQDYVDKETLDLFTRGERVGWRDKAVFCESHRRKDAEQLWRSKGYPDIDCNPDALKTRMQQYHTDIHDILDGKVSSEFLDRLKSKVNTGRIRKALRDVHAAKSEIVTPGYYGPRGSQVFQAHLVEAFGEKLQNMATGGNEEVRVTGAGNYIARVLVPEMAARLIAEDMGLGLDEVGLEKARNVMEESAEVGRLVNGTGEEEDDVAVKMEKI